MLKIVNINVNSGIIFSNNISIGGQVI